MLRCLFPVYFNMSTNATTSSSPPEHDALRTYSKLEILQTLRKIQRNQILLHISSTTEERGVVTTILDVPATNTHFIIDAAPDNEVNQLLARSTSNRLETYVDRILVSFETGAAQACEFKKKPALSLPLPESVHRLQRRRYYRVSIPVSNPASISFALKDKQWNFPLHDINAGGVALHDDTLSLEAQAGILIRDAQLILPGVRTLNLDLLFIRTQDHALPSGRPIRRIGCTFLNLTGDAQMAIQTYINQIERQEIARQKGLL